MRSTRPRRSLTLASLGAGLAALVALAARPAAAQRAAGAPIRPAAGATVAPTGLRPVAIYRFVPTRVAGMPTEVTVADSAGQLVAHFRLPGAAAERPMLVALIGEQLILQGETPSGVLTLRLRDPEHVPGTRAVVGRWHLEGRQGELRARTGR